ncbi:MAG: MoaD/ThiS family protein [Gemmatimonadetes bacterium]|nr:MoaD/ThiS family protein [Gemmatimonadota bacterium]
MAVTVVLPSVLARFAGGQRTHASPAGTIEEVLARVAQPYPELGKRLADATRDGNEFVTVYLNDEDTRFSGGFETYAADGDEVTIVSAIAGG